jgi:arginine deiminase
LKKHDGFITALEAQREKITTLEQLAQALLAQDHYASKQIESRRKGVVDRMERVQQMTEARRQKLLDARTYQQFLCNVYEVFLFVIIIYWL